MDSLVASAAHALAAGDPLGALKRVALRDDPPALALRGIAMAQLGDYEPGAQAPAARRARLRRPRAPRPGALPGRRGRGRARRARPEPAGARARSGRARRSMRWAITRTRCTPASSAPAAISSSASWRPPSETLAAVDVAAGGVPPPLAARAELTRAELALRRVRVADAAAALGRAHAAAVAAGIPALIAEVGRARRALSAPSARLIRGGVVRPVRLDEVEALFASGDLIVDACRRAVRGPARCVPLAGRPVLFALVGALAEAWPADVPRDRLIERAFEARAVNESHRARLRVELGRLRAALRPLARIEATPRGFALVPGRRPRPSSCWLRRSTVPPALSSPCWRAASRGRPRRSRVRSARASEPSSARCASSRRRRRCAPSAAADPAAGSRRRSADSRQPCYSRARCRLGSLGSWQRRESKTKQAEILREYGPYPGMDQVHGVTFDGAHVWFARGESIVALDPDERRAGPRARRRRATPAPPSTANTSGSSPATGSRRSTRARARSSPPSRRRPTGRDSGLTWAEGTLWVGEYRARKIHQIDAETGAILRTIESDRFVTGVSWVNGELWHATMEDERSELRRVDPETGEGPRAPRDAGRRHRVSGLEADGAGVFYCGGGTSGKVRAVRKP